MLTVSYLKNDSVMFIYLYVYIYNYLCTFTFYIYISILYRTDCTSFLALAPPWVK